MKIMYICTGNICRSAMAHHLTIKKAKDMEIDDIEVFSCGVQAYNGDVPTWEAKSVIKEEFDVDMNQHKATNIKDSDIKEMDIIFCATKKHKESVINMYCDLKEKVYTMKEYIKYNREYHDKIDIKDPWGYDIDTYRSCLAEIEECVINTLKKIKKERENK